MNQPNKQIFFPIWMGLDFFAFYPFFSTNHAAIKTTAIYKVVKYRLFGNGNLGVNFFFVLSGFLITYLLLSEQKNFRRIHLGNFYIKRALRIWPLFYFCGFFGFILFPIFKKAMGFSPDEKANPVFYLFFINNFDFLKHGADSSVLSILWSVAIEEQFYLIWPVFLMLVNRNVFPFVSHC
jgi:peptidoglycan/LPS O-acetylase OafA/YrhL